MEFKFSLTLNFHTHTHTQRENPVRTPGETAVYMPRREVSGGSQARGLIGAVAAHLRQSHSNGESEPHLQPTPQLTATPDP